MNICYASRQQYGGSRLLRTVSGSSTVVPNSLGTSTGQGNRRQSMDGNNYGAQDNHCQKNEHYVILDTPGTTNEITYALQQHSYNNTYQFNYNRSHDNVNDTYTYIGRSTIMLQEILPTDNSSY